MLYLCLAMILDMAIFTVGLTMSIIDVNRYNFGLYLVLMSVVAFSLLVALWVAKPKFCQTPSWAIQFYHSAVKSSRSSYQASVGETETLMERPNADEIMRSIRGIPLLIQAIQYSLEAAYVATRDPITVGPTITDSAIDSSHDYYPTLATTSTDPSQTSSINGNTETGADSTVGSIQRHRPTGSDRRIQLPLRRRLTDLKRQSIFVVFPYSETVPIDQTKLRMRRSSSEHDLDCALRGKRKSSFELFCAAAIAGHARCSSTMLTHSGQKPDCDDERDHACACQTGSEPVLKMDSIKKTEVRRPSLEVRYVGLQGILLAKMSEKQRQDST